MNKTLNEIIEIVDTIEYGFLDEKGKNIIDENPQKWDKEFGRFYYLLTPEELLEKKCGVCWDQVELERKLFEEKGIKVITYFICSYVGTDKPCHTFLSYTYNNKYYWFEHAWGRYKGIHEYNSEEELLLDVKNKFIASNNVDKGYKTIIYEYFKPNIHISCEEFYNFCEDDKNKKI